MQLTDIASCAAAIERWSMRVALAREMEVPTRPGAAPPPAGAALWTSEYAQLLLWPVASNESEAIVQAADEGEGWLDAALSAADGPSRIPIDGYLVLALPEAPTVEADQVVRRVELSSTICRKHLVWPSSAAAVAEGAEPWARVTDVTLLGLPDVGNSASDGLYWPPISGDAETLWRDLREKGASSVVETDANGPIPLAKSL